MEAGALFVLVVILVRWVVLVWAFIVEYWVEALFGGVIACLGVVCGRLSRRANEQEAIREGIQALSRVMIVQQYNHYMEKGCCPIYALENVESLYGAYHALGGNGTVTTLVENLRGLPTDCRGRGGNGHE